MVRNFNRSGSISRSRSFDSTSTRRLNITEKNLTLKENGDVQVFTSLPPNVEGQIKFYIILEVSKINLFIDRPIRDENVRSKSKNKEVYVDYDLSELDSSLVAECLWWGEEETKGSIFRPNILADGVSLNKDCTVQTTAKYVVRSGYKQLSAYLNDMKTLDIDIINENSLKVIGRVQIHEIGKLSQTEAVKGVFPAFDESKLKVAEIHLYIRLVPAVKDLPTNNPVQKHLNIKQKSLKQSKNPTTKNQKLSQLDSDHLVSENSQLKDTLTTVEHPIKKEEFITKPIISTLIERGDALRSQIVKSLNSFPNPVDDILLKQNSVFNSNLKIPFEHSLILSSSMDGFEYDSFNEYIDLENHLLRNQVLPPFTNDHCPELLSINLHNTFTNKQDKLDEDKELKELLQPPNNVLYKLKKQPISTEIICSSKNQTQDDKNTRFLNIKNYLTSMSCNLATSIDTDQKNDTPKYHNVSFDLESSDNDTYNSSITSESLQGTCVDSLSTQRIALLNLVQLAKLKIDKITFISNDNKLSKIIERTNSSKNIQQEKINDKNNCKRTAASTNKPPKVIKPRQEAFEFFFIEYQFPVLTDTTQVTQSMRVVAKKQCLPANFDDTLKLDHNADYSVLFNSNSLENWWRSSISLKVYCRSTATPNTSANQNASHNMPHLIGEARLNLRNVLRSKNFKLIKRLAVYDSLKLQKNDNRKRIGSLHVSIELTSDIQQFHTELIKLKNFENKNQNTKKPVQPTLSKIIKSSINEKELAASNCDKDRNVSFSDIIKSSTTSTIPTKTKHIESNKKDFTILVNLYFTINESRDFEFDSNVHDNSNKIYFICRLFWCKEKVKLEANSRWSFNLSFMLSPVLVKKMKKNFMVIEAYQKDTNSLIGTIKLPLHEFHLKFSDVVDTNHFLTNIHDYPNPLIGVQGWFTSNDPFTGKKTGEVNATLAIGSFEQIINLQKTQYHKNETKMNSMDAQDITEHLIYFTLENLHIRQTPMTDHSKYFVKYEFLSGENVNPTNSGLSLDTLIEELKFSEFMISTDTSSRCNQHRFFTLNSYKLMDIITKMYYQKKYESNLTLNFSVWSMQVESGKEVCLGQSFLLFDQIIDLMDTKLNYVQKSLVLSVNSINKALPDRFLGHMTLKIGYKRINNVCLSQTFKANSKQIFMRSVVLNIGVLKAIRLDHMIKNIAIKNGISASINSEVYIKTGISFLSKCQKSNQTHPVSSSHGRCSLDFFDYFDVECPLIATTYKSGSNRTITLAEQLVNGKVTFEVYARFLEIKSGQKYLETLLGTCVVPLDALLEDRMGVHDMFPIQTMDEMSVRRIVGDLEVVIRFTKHEDILNIIKTATEIGWKNKYPTEKEMEYEKASFYADSCKSKSTENLFDKSALKGLVNTNETVHCQIEIERAVNLQSPFNDKAPNTFVSLEDSKIPFIKTVVCVEQSAPEWNFKHEIDINREYFFTDAKPFLLHVWYEEALQQEKLFGTVSIDLSPLVYGLAFISGWYNIVGLIGNCLGQIKLNILPKEDLTPLRDQIERRRKAGFSSQSESKCTFMHKTSFRSRSNSSSYQSHSLAQQTTNIKEVKQVLAMNLIELEKLNLIFKERLIKSDGTKKSPIDYVRFQVQEMDLKNSNFCPEVEDSNENKNFHKHIKNDEESQKINDKKENENDLEKEDAVKVFEIEEDENYVDIEDNLNQNEKHQEITDEVKVLEDDEDEKESSELEMVETFEIEENGRLIKDQESVHRIESKIQHLNNSYSSGQTYNDSRIEKEIIPINVNQNTLKSQCKDETNLVLNSVSRNEFSFSHNVNSYVCEEYDKPTLLYDSFWFDSVGATESLLVSSEYVKTDINKQKTIPETATEYSLNNNEVTTDKDPTDTNFDMMIGLDSLLLKESYEMPNILFDRTVDSRIENFSDISKKTSIYTQKVSSQLEIEGLELHRLELENNVEPGRISYEDNFILTVDTGGFENLNLSSNKVKETEYIQHTRKSLVVDPDNFCNEKDVSEHDKADVFETKNEQTEDRDICELKDEVNVLSSRMPNYFLPHEELKKSMTKLYHNYNKDDSYKNRSKHSEPLTEDYKKKSKIKISEFISTNEHLDTNNFHRLNKIFNSK